MIDYDEKNESTKTPESAPRVYLFILVCFINNYSSSSKASTQCSQNTKTKSYFLEKVMVPIATTQSNFPFKHQISITIN